jgi:phosphoglycolate phosphatase-like HAD superfamily hydrolase
MKLAVFDLDGTLLATSGVDDDCYVRAVRDVFGIEGISTDWGAYPHSTDGAILRAVVEQHLERTLAADDLQRMQDRFVALLTEEAAARPERFRATPGAHEAFSALRAAGWHPAIATGGWKRSALLKLAAADLAIDGVAAAFADDHESREGIIQAAIARSGATPSRVTYIGDGVWDLKAARNLGIGFGGVATGARAAALRAGGAVIVHADLTDIAALLG